MTADHQRIFGTALVFSIGPFKPSATRFPTMVSIRVLTRQFLLMCIAHLCKQATNTSSQLVSSNLDIAGINFRETFNPAVAEKSADETTQRAG